MMLDFHDGGCVMKRLNVRKKEQDTNSDEQVLIKSVLSFAFLAITFAFAIYIQQPPRLNLSI
jgi:hypothetical protein